MFVYKKLFSFPSIFFQTDNGSSGGNAGEGGSANPGTSSSSSEEGNQPPSSQEGKTDDNGQGSGSNTEEKTIPYQRFLEINNKTKELQTQLDNLLQEKKKAEKAKEKTEREAKEKQGEFETLYSETKSKYEQIEIEHTATRNRIETLEAVVQELLDNELKEIDKEYVDIIPENLSVEQKLSWIAKAKAKGLFGSKKEENSIGGPANPSQPTRKVAEMTPHELFKMAFSKK